MQDLFEKILSYLISLNYYWTFLRKGSGSAWIEKFHSIEPDLVLHSASLKHNGAYSFTLTVSETQTCRSRKAVLTFVNPHSR